MKTLGFLLISTVAFGSLASADGKVTIINNGYSQHNLPKILMMNMTHNQPARTTLPVPLESQEFPLKNGGEYYRITLYDNNWTILASCPLDKVFIVDNHTNFTITINKISKKTSCEVNGL